MVCSPKANQIKYENGLIKEDADDHDEKTLESLIGAERVTAEGTWSPESLSSAPTTVPWK
ncbi:hypothetical protein STEG23_006133, partial [Scotinomys teguina]